jgi:hypothetical protein
MQLGQEIEHEREKLAQEAANPSTREKEERAATPVAASQSSASVTEGKNDTAVEAETETFAEPLAAAGSLVSVDGKAEAPPDTEVKPIVEVLVEAAQEDDVKMEE